MNNLNAAQQLQSKHQVLDTLYMEALLTSVEMRSFDQRGKQRAANFTFADGSRLTMQRDNDGVLSCVVVADYSMYTTISERCYGVNYVTVLARTNYHGVDEYFIELNGAALHETFYSPADVSDYIAKYIK